MIAELSLQVSNEEAEQLKGAFENAKACKLYMSVKYRKQLWVCYNKIKMKT